MKPLAWGRLLEIAQRTAWALFLLCLPVTSFPYFPRVFGGSALVRPLSLYPLLVLIVLLTLPRLLSQPVPRTLRTLLPFVLLAVAASLVSLLRGIEPTFGVSVTNRILRGLMTLAIGAAIYYTTALASRTPEDLRASLRWLYAGFTAALTWGSLQAVYVLRFNSSYYHFLDGLQAFISTRKLFTTRVSGMTYEPNWFAAQISLLLMPWLLAAVLSGYSVYRRRWRWLTFELVLLAWALLVLAFTYSRAGLANLLILAFLAFLFFRHAPGETVRSPRRVWYRRLAEAGVVLLVLTGLIYTAGRTNTFFARIWDYWNDVQKTSLADYFEYIGFGARFTYSETAYRIYQAHPLIGVGLGNYAFYYPDLLPDQPLAAYPELLRTILPDDGRDRLITPKNFYLRLLAETGLAGAAAFAAFLASLAGCAMFLWRSPHPEHRFWGRAAWLGLIAFAAAAFSFDSFAIPNTWVVFGLSTSAAWIFSHPDQNLPEGLI